MTEEIKKYLKKSLSSGTTELHVVGEHIKKHSLEESPNECCGVILENDGLLVSKRCINISETPASHCLFSGQELEDKIEGLDIFAFYHSHLNGKEFSWEDKAVSEKLGKNAILYCIKDDAFNFYQPNGWIAPLVGRKWSWGIFSCRELVEDFYGKFLDVEFVGQKELIFDLIPFVEGIDLMPAYFKSRQDNKEGRFFKEMVKKYKKTEIYLNFLKHNGFKEVKDLKKHDLILTKTWNEKWNEEFGIDYGIHSIIYLGNDKILHHPWKRTSKIEKFKTRYKQVITNILRHETK